MESAPLYTNTSVGASIVRLEYKYTIHTFVDVVSDSGIKQQNAVNEAKLGSRSTAAVSAAADRADMSLLAASTSVLAELFLVLCIRLELRRSPLLGQLQPIGHRHLVHASQFSDQLGVTGHFAIHTTNPAESVTHPLRSVCRQKPTRQWHIISMTRHASLRHRRRKFSSLLCFGRRRIDNKQRNKRVSLSCRDLREHINSYCSTARAFHSIFYSIFYSFSHGTTITSKQSDDNVTI